MHWVTLSTIITTLNIKHLKRYACLHFIAVFSAIFFIIAVCGMLALLTMNWKLEWFSNIYLNFQFIFWFIIIYYAIMLLFVTQRSGEIYKFTKKEAEPRIDATQENTLIKENVEVKMVTVKTLRALSGNRFLRRAAGSVKILLYQRIKSLVLKIFNSMHLRRKKDILVGILKKCLRVFLYFFYPRLNDFVKGSFIVLGFFAGASAIQNNLYWGDMIQQLFFVWLVFEFMAYQARYQWNDIRGLKEDLEHEKRDDRLRLPAEILGPRYSVHISFVIFVLRGCFVIWFIPQHYLKMSLLYKIVLTALTFLIFVWALFYERARTDDKDKQGKITIGLVGFGYALRFAAGWISVNSQKIGLCFALAGILYVWGVGFVSMTWVLEAAYNVQKKPERSLKKHLQYLFNQIPSGQRNDPYPLKKAIWKTTIWDCAYYASIIAFSITLLSLVDHSQLLLLLLQIMSICLLFLSTKIDLDKPSQLFCLFVAMFILFCEGCVLYTFNLPMVICACKFICFITYAAFRLMNYDSIYSLRGNAIKAMQFCFEMPSRVKKRLFVLWVWFIGQSTYELLNKEKKPEYSASKEPPVSQ